MINTPQGRAFGYPSIYIHGPKFESYQNPKQENNDLLVLTDPLKNQKFSDDVDLVFARNQNIKDNIFYEVIRKGEVKTYCCKVDEENNVYAVNIQIQTNNHVSQKDVWLHLNHNFSDNQDQEIYQTVHITKGDQTARLTTRVPDSLKCNFTNVQDEEDNKFVTRESGQFCQLMADHPCIVYNLGDSKLVLQNTLLLDEKRCYILELPKGDKFVGFVRFNQFEDIGFYPKNLSIECCSHFLFMTTSPRNNKSGPKSIKNNNLNLLFIDPYCSKVQCCMFKSKHFFDDGIFDQNDFTICNVIQSTMGKKRDNSFKTYIWSQFEYTLIRSKILKEDDNDELDAKDSDEEKDPAQHVENQLELMDEFEIQENFVFEPIPLQMNDKDFIYYIKKKNGKCYIYEGNPRDPYLINHQAIFSLKADKCLAFNIDQDQFYFMDENYIVYQLQRNENNRNLTLVKELTLKEIQRSDFRPKQFDTTIVRQRYAIQARQMFFLYDCSDEPFIEGILDSEDLITADIMKTKLEYIRGPFLSQGSNKFFLIFRQNKFKSNIKLFDLPESYQQVLINDFLNKVDMSTYIEKDGDILVKVYKRFMTFTQKGEFIDEVEFKDNLYDQSNEKQINQIEALEQIVGKRNPFNQVKKVSQTRLKPRVQIYDFLGHPYKYNEPDPPQPPNNVNKMQMLQMSANNKLFLFYNRLTKNILVYKLKKIFDDDGNNDNKQSASYEFQVQYEVQFSQSFLFQHMYSQHMDPIDFFCNNCSQIKLDNSGQVKMCYVENMPFVEDGDKNSDDDEYGGQQMVQCRIVGSIFRQDGTTFSSKCENFSHVFDFPREANIKMSQVIEEKITQLVQKIGQIWNKQKRLPKSLFDYGEYENLIEDLQDLENKRSDIIYAKLFYEDLVVIYSGKFLKYGRLTKNKKKKNSHGAKGKEMEIILEKGPDRKIFQNIDINFGPRVEIIKIIETLQKNWLQIVTRCHDQDILTIITWDFDNNMEQRHLQHIIDDKSEVGSHVVCGMNQKLNYYIDKYKMYDLEFGIPIRQVNVDQQLDPTCVSYTHQVSMLDDFFNQRKVFLDNQTFLGIEKPSCQFQNINYLDILLWQNIYQLGEKPELIKKTCTLRQLNLVIDGYSIFHYFAAKDDVMETIQEKFDIYKQNGLVADVDKELPLQIINPDNDGQTAIFLALTKQSPKSFECMIEMIADFPNLCISKMLLKSYSEICENENESVINFFENGGVFQPPQMQQTQWFVPWNKDLDEVIFSSHTAYISKELLLDKLAAEGVTQEQIDFNEIEQSQKKDHVHSQKERQERIRQLKNTLRPQTLHSEFSVTETANTKNQKRVTIEAIDMDWIFYENNSEKLLSILSDCTNEKVLTKKSIKIFINFMWKYYQKAIITKIFCPYVLYLVLITFLSGSTVRAYGEMFDDDGYDITQQTNSFWTLTIQAWVECIMAFFLMIYFLSFEIEQMLTSQFEYLTDPWNCVDSLSIILNINFLSLFMINLIFQDVIISTSTINIFGAFTQWIMWIKIFYWMRLFPSLAYYVKLIIATIGDCLPFMYMVIIIMCAFANFFYVINTNLIHEDNNLSYFDHHTGIDAIDSFIAVYFAGTVGNFTPTYFSQGKTMKYYSVFMFILTLLIIDVFFMNMLIAIMQETFTNVLNSKEENGLREQVQLIADHAKLLDLAKEFKGQKYIMRMRPGSSDDDITDIVVDQVQEQKMAMTKMISRMQNQLVKRIDHVDINTRHLIKHQFDAIATIQKKLKVIQTNIIEESRKNDQGQDTLNQTSFTQQRKQQIQSRKMEILNAINQSQSSGHILNLENVQEIALRWMDVADKDGNGELDFAEFHEFFSNVEGVNVTTAEIREIFDEFDSSKNECLSCQEFVRAIYKALQINITMPDQEILNIEDEESFRRATVRGSLELSRRMNEVVAESEGSQRIENRDSQIRRSIKSKTSNKKKQVRVSEISEQIDSKVNQGRN